MDAQSSGQPAALLVKIPVERASANPKILGCSFSRTPAPSACDLVWESNRCGAGADWVYLLYMPIQGRHGSKSRDVSPVARLKAGRRLAGRRVPSAPARYSGGGFAAGVATRLAPCKIGFRLR